MFEHSTALTSQIARRKLAGFDARLGILEIEGKNKRPPLEGGLFHFPRRNHLVSAKPISGEVRKLPATS
jgi:hypothetical protein